MKQYSIREIASVAGAEAVRLADENVRVQTLLTDSRRLADPSGSLFFAIRGERHDGHRFISDLAAKGVSSFVISEEIGKYGNIHANFIQVKDTTAALQALASFHRLRYSIPVVGITGSNGKTIVKEWLYQLLRQDKNIVRSPKSYNSQIGVPLSVWQMGDEHELAIFEAGISEPDEMEKLEKIIRPTVGIFTNIGQAHDENFRSPKEKVREKLMLFQRSDLLIYCKDLDLVREALPPTLKTFTWSRNTDADLKIFSVEKKNSDTRIWGIYRNKEISIDIPFTDSASVENAITAWCYMLQDGYDRALIAERMLLLSPVAMRLELKNGINNCSIINDSYNSDLGSLEIALDFLNQQQQHPMRTLVLSDILQSGRSEASLYAEVAELLKRKGVDRLIGIGSSVKAHASLFSLRKDLYSSTEEFLESFDSSRFRDETILIKGARVFGFERITRLLQLKAHKTVLEIDLNALVHNLNYFRSRLQPGVKVMAMVKAASYGSGSFEIANMLQFHRVDYLAVAYADEGIELRKSGITLPIMVMSPEEQSFDSLVEYRLEPEIYSLRVLRGFKEFLKKKDRKRYPVHIKLDTGMHRLGFEEPDMQDLLAELRLDELLEVKSVFSHMVGSEDPAHDDFSRSQFARFDAMYSKLSSVAGGRIIRHILNSAGILRFPEAHMDMVRLGVGLYGVAPDEREQQKLQQIATLKTTISQIKVIRAGDTIGYSRKGIAAHEMRIATVAIGYADGLSRKLSNGRGSMRINGKKAPVIGNICMDMCMLDITGIPAREGDEVIVFGPGYSISDMARDMETIPYEVFTSLSQRIKRVYYQE